MDCTLHPLPPRLLLFGSLQRLRMGCLCCAGLLGCPRFFALGHFLRTRLNKFIYADLLCPAFIVSFDLFWLPPLLFSALATSFCRAAFAFDSLSYAAAAMYSSDVSMMDLPNSMMGSRVHAPMRAATVGRVRNRVMEPTPSHPASKPTSSSSAHEFNGSSSTKKCTPFKFGTSTKLASRFGSSVASAFSSHLSPSP